MPEIDNNKITHSNLRIEVLVYHYVNPPRRIYLGNDPVKIQKISKWVTSWNYSKSIDQPDGAFERNSGQFF